MQEELQKAKDNQRVEVVHKSSCFMPDAEVLLVSDDGSNLFSKRVDAVQIGDKVFTGLEDESSELASGAIAFDTDIADYTKDDFSEFSSHDITGPVPRFRYSPVLFIDTTELGSRSLMGINGRAPRITEDHPLQNGRRSDFEDFEDFDEISVIKKSETVNELITFDTDNATKMRHWKNLSKLSSSDDAEDFSTIVTFDEGEMTAGLESVETIDFVKIEEDGKKSKQSTKVYDIVLSDLNSQFFFVDHIRHEYDKVRHLSLNSL